MNGMSFYVQVVRALDEIGAPYMLVGAFAGTAFGITRATYDIDILVDMQEEHFQPLADRFPLPRYYADPVMMRNSTRLGIMFNLIDTEEGVKADLVPLKREPEYRLAFERRIRRAFVDPQGVKLEAWCARPEDIIVGKLQAWAEGESSKHPADISAILAFLLSDENELSFDLAIVSRAIRRMDKKVLTLWQELLARAEQEVNQHKEGSND
ncbi:MAG: hypothetical protein FJ010_03835 [Chloroflexi bacterium]|nr:hypothetical protein [Chloroflexota bacterium]